MKGVGVSGSGVGLLNGQTTKRDSIASKERGGCLSKQNRG
jgi:hypothetical protein